MYSEFRAEIQQRLKAAMVQACKDILNFTDNPASRFNAEYLFTVDAAKAICEMNFSEGDPYKLFIEKNAEQFARDCLNQISYERTPGHWLKPRRAVLRTTVPKLVRKGRIDVCVYSEVPGSGYFGAQPLCAIELKGFDPQPKLVLADLKRNLEYHRVVGNTGGSILELSFFGALHSYRRHQSKTQAQRNEDRVRRLYERRLSQIGPVTDVEQSIDAFTVRHEPFGRVIDDVQEQVLDTSASHHFVGAIVTFWSRRRPITGFGNSGA